MVRIPGFHCHGPGSFPGQGTEIPQATWRGQKKKGGRGVLLVSAHGLNEKVSEELSRARKPG